MSRDDNEGAADENLSRADIQQLAARLGAPEDRLKDLKDLYLDASVLIDPEFGGLGRFDTNGDEHFSQDEFTKPLDDPEVGDYSKVIVRKLVENFGELNSPDVGGSELGMSMKFADSRVSDLNCELYFPSFYNNIELPETSDVFADGLDSVTPDAIKQGSVGDCYFLAALGSLAAVDLESIFKMFPRQPDPTGLDKPWV